LLSDHAVKSYISPIQMFHTGTPYLYAVTLTAIFRFDDIEAQKAKIIAIPNCRNCGNGLIAKQPDKEPFSIC